MQQERYPKSLSQTTTWRQRLLRRLRAGLARYRRLLFVTGGGMLPLLLFLSAPGPAPLYPARVAAADTTAVEAPPPQPAARPAPEPARNPAAPSPPGPVVASYYSPALEGNPTASGEPYDPDELTAAHRTLPMGTRVRVTNVRNGRSVVVRVNDRGPFIARRVIDLSHAAARQLGMLRSGVARVRLEKLPS